MGAETERCSRHDGFYPKQTDLYRQFFIIRTSFVRKVLNICPLLPFQAPKNSLYIFWKWDSLMPISPYIKFKSWTVKLELYSIRSKRSTNTSYIICYFIFWLKFSGHLPTALGHRKPPGSLFQPSEMTELSTVPLWHFLTVCYGDNRQWISTWNWYLESWAVSHHDPETINYDPSLYFTSNQTVTRGQRNIYCAWSTVQESIFHFRIYLLFGILTIFCSAGLNVMKSITV